MLMRCAVLIVLTATLGTCASSSDVKQLWRFETKKSHRQWGLADAQRLYLCADDVYCLDIATGRLLWEFKTFGTHASPPVVDEGRLYFQCGGLYALDAATGRVLWEFWTNDWAKVAPAVAAGRVYATAGKRLYCLDATDGRRLWSRAIGPGAGSLVAIGERVFSCAGESIVCRDAAQGHELWRFKTGSEWVPLTRAGGLLLSVEFKGPVRAHRVDTGEVLWQLAMDRPFARLSVADAGYVLVSAGVLYCRDPANGEPVWIFSRDQVAVNRTSVLGRQALACISRAEILRLDMHDGSLLGTVSLPPGGRLLTDGTGAVFFRDGKSRTVTCMSVPAL